MLAEIRPSVRICEDGTADQSLDLEVLVSVECCGEISTDRQTIYKEAEVLQVMCWCGALFSLAVQTTLVFAVKTTEKLGAAHS